VKNGDVENLDSSCSWPESGDADCYKWRRDT